ncbi:hypothetical protein QR97_02230 [Streptomyces sp. PBH53]|uniref:hypothetical protein n=1 Tax=Streptomyces sp. PBH53 TaxID=1577075 RepID=UPI000655807A|nr:hypothetical protein [Streptomyces sp. PBH53]AKN68776.1 hypothetical protein QR97_02230 [Streptomyces sp. PBH53]
MADAQPSAADVSAEIKRLTKQPHQRFFETWTTYVLGGVDNKRVRRDVQAAAFASRELAGRTLLAADRAAREVRTILLRGEDETKRAYQARVNAFRERLKQAREPIVDTVELLAADEAEVLARLDDEAFAKEWAAFLQQPPSGRSGRDTVQSLAFRSLKVAPRTYALSVDMLREPEKYLSEVEGEARKARDARVELLRVRLETEMRFLQYALNYAEARWGRMPTARNDRLHAMRLLAERYPEEFSSLLNAVRADRKRARDEVRRQRRYERRAQARSAT